LVLYDHFDFRYLGKQCIKVEKALDESLTADGPNVATIVESMKYSLMAGGKRIRPVICLAACEMFGGSETVAMPTAVALEMIHTMSLIHDDLPAMDNDDLRRGKPTNHVLYGDDVAILAGDALLSTSFEHVARETKNVDPTKVLDVIRRLGTSVGAWGLAGGQVSISLLLHFPAMKRHFIFFSINFSRSWTLLARIKMELH
jgi:geranylgeranyl diphosphate synthase type II